MLDSRNSLYIIGFNSQPLEGGCDSGAKLGDGVVVVSTHSRSKAAARQRGHA